MSSRHADGSVCATVIDSTEEKTPDQVLVVNEASEVWDIIAWLLRSRGYRALATTDGSVVKALLSREHAVLIVYDLPEPVFHGWDLLAFCHARCPHIPVLLMSGAAFAQWPEVERWASCFSRQPFDAARFRTGIQRHLIPYAAAQR
jgi:DNA-binding NtrC family response regulator